MAIMSRNGFAMSTQDNKELWGYYDDDGVLIAWWSPTLSQIKVNGNKVTSSPYTTPPVYTLTIDQSNESATKAYVKIKDPTLTSCRNMFSYLKNLKSVDVTNMNTSNVTDMYMMFYRCLDLEKIDVSNFDTSKVGNFKWVFSGCYSLKDLDLSNFDFSSAYDLEQMFYWSPNIETIDLSGKTFGTYGKSREVYGDDVVDKQDYNWGCYEMFYNCCLTKGTTAWDYPPEKGSSKQYGKVYECKTPLKFVNLSNTRFNDETIFAYAFSNSKFLENVDLTNISNPYNKSSFALFDVCMSLKNLDMSTWSWGKDAQYAFQHCRGLETIDISHTDVSQLENTKEMFSNCINLKYFDGSNVNPTKLKNCAEMFFLCTSLEWCDLSSWTLENCSTSYTNSMFNNCFNLKWIDLKNTTKSINCWSTYNLEWIYVDNVTDEVIWEIITNLNSGDYHLRYEYILGTKNGRKAIVRGEYKG